MSFHQPITKRLPTTNAGACGFVTAGIVLTLLSGCGTFSGQQDSAPDVAMDWDSIADAVPRREPLSERGNPESYSVNGKRYFVNFDTAGFKQQGIASWYGTKFHGRTTSSGEPYDMYKMTAAHKTLPLPSYVKVTNLRNQKQVIVKVNDRGPFVGDRIIDLSYAAAQKLDIAHKGTAHVEIEIAPADIVDHTASTNDTSNGQIKNGTNEQASRYYVQLGAFTQRSHAEQLRNRLDQEAISPVTITPKTNHDSILYLVRVGPLPGKQQLKSLEVRLAELGYSESYIILE
ncbi:MAG: septal ring lytic transglycosylase RlpA family protein [Gammaproteobacteria bacterium]